MPHECVNCGRTFPDGSTEMLSGCPDCDGNKFQFTPVSPTDDDRPNKTDDSTFPSSRDENSEPPPSGDENSEPPPSGDENSEPPPSGDDDQFGVTMKTADSSTLAGTDSVADDADSDEPGSTASDPARDDASPARDDTDPAGAEPNAPDGPTGEIVGDVTDEEDDAQADARSAVVDKDELSAAGRDGPPKTDDDPAAGEGTPTPPEASVDEADASDQVATDPAASGQPPTTDDSDESPDLAALREELNEQFESIKIVAPGQYELNLMELYDRDEYIISLQEDGRYVIEVPESWHGDDG